MAISLSSLRKTGVARPPRIVVYGTHGIGKSTFAANAPAPVFIQTEEGLDAINVDAFPLCTSYEEMVDAIGALASEDHEFATVVVDSADWAEQLIHKRVAQDNNVATIDAIGYGRGYKAAADYWRQLLDGLDHLRNEKNMQVILLAHTQVKRFDDPLADPYDRYQLDLHHGSASLVSEWCDILMFANQQYSTVKSDVGFNQKVTRAVGNGNRVLYTQERPGWQAKSRWSLPDSLPLDYAKFSEALASSMNQVTGE
jgi:hypothetical protein